MNRRRFLLALAVLLGGGGLALAYPQLAYLWTRGQVSRLDRLPTLPHLPPPISRADWGARPVNHEAVNEYGFASARNRFGWLTYTQDLAAVYHTVVVHHSALLWERGETMATIQALHMDRNGWADIGYHFGIDGDGLIYAGRDIQARGASVAGHNAGLIGVVVMGNFELQAPRPVQLTALQTLVNWLAATYRLTTLAGHGEFNPESVCPGRFMTLYLDLLAQGAGLERYSGT